MKKMLLLGVVLTVTGCGLPVVYEGKYSTARWDGTRVIVTPKPEAIGEITDGKLRVEAEK